LSALNSYADHLPGWNPVYIVAGALGFDAKGIDRVVEDLQGRPYVWATEFENVHTRWEFSEPEITVQGNTYSYTESFYHAQKPFPFDESEWLTCRVAAMREGLRQKFLNIQGKAKVETIGRAKMSSRHEQGKTKAETFGRAKMSSRQEQEKARTTNISGKRNHGKVIKTRAPGTARDAGATGTGGDHQEHQEQLQVLRGLCPFSLAHFRNPCCISGRDSAM